MAFLSIGRRNASANAFSDQILNILLNSHLDGDHGSKDPHCGTCYYRQFKINIIYQKSLCKTSVSRCPSLCVLQEQFIFKDLVKMRSVGRNMDNAADTHKQYSSSALCACHFCCCGSCTGSYVKRCFSPYVSVCSRLQSSSSGCTH